MRTFASLDTLDTPDHPLEAAESANVDDHDSPDADTPNRGADSRPYWLRGYSEPPAPPAETYHWHDESLWIKNQRDDIGAGKQGTYPFVWEKPHDPYYATSPRSQLSDLDHAPSQEEREPSEPPLFFNDPEDIGLPQAGATQEELPELPAGRHSPSSRTLVEVVVPSVSKNTRSKNKRRAADDDDEDDETPARPSKKALGKRRIAEDDDEEEEAPASKRPRTSRAKKSKPGSGSVDPRDVFEKGPVDGTMRRIDPNDRNGNWTDRTKDSKPYGKHDRSQPMMRLPASRRNDRSKKEHFPSRVPDLEPGMVVSDERCDNAHKDGKLSTFGVGLNQHGKPRGPGISKCDYCIFRKVPCTMTRGNSTKKQRLYDTVATNLNTAVDLLLKGPSAKAVAKVITHLGVAQEALKHFNPRPWLDDESEEDDEPGPSTGKKRSK